MSHRNLKFAGSFFPKDPVALHHLMDGFDSALNHDLTAKVISPIAIIAPHAGYQFSGQLAAMAYASCRGQMPKRVVVLSPSHRCAFDGIAVSKYQAYEVAGQVLSVDSSLRDDLLKRGLVLQNNAAHSEEHGIETQLPFISRSFSGAQVLPLVIGKATAQAVAALIDHIVSIVNENLLFVLSSDLSHFHSRDVAQKLDNRAASLIETGQYDRLEPKQACGYTAIVGFLASGMGRNTRVCRLAMADSFAVTQDANRVVGYGAWAFFAPDCEVLPQKQRETILRVARQGTSMFLKAHRNPKIMLSSFVMPLRGYNPSFITFAHNERLRGCIGSLVAQAPLISDVVANSIKAATEDLRFIPLKSEKQLEKLSMKVAVLSRAIPLNFTDQDDLLSQMTPGAFGLILQFGARRATFLPMVWDSLPDRKNFLNGLKAKAGLPLNFWSKEIKVMQFWAESFSDTHKTDGGGPFIS